MPFTCPFSILSPGLHGNVPVVGGGALMNPGKGLMMKEPGLLDDFVRESHLLA